MAVALVWVRFDQTDLESTSEKLKEVDPDRKLRVVGNTKKNPLPIANAKTLGQ